MILKSIVIKHKENTLYDCTFSDSNRSKRNLFSVIIGQNGTGKSHLLRLICNALRNDSELNKRYESTVIKYRLNGKNYVRTHPEETTNLKPLPDSIIALSFSVNDKFEFIDGRHQDNYSYLGSRSSSNATFTSSLKRQLLDSIAKIYTDENRLDRFIDLLLKLNLGQLVTASFRLLFPSSIITEDEFIRRLDANKHKSKNKNIVIIEETVGEAYRLWFENRKLKKRRINISPSCWSEIDLELSSRLEVIKVLEIAGLARLEKLKFEKTEMIDYEDASSGEQHLLYSVANCIAAATDNSLILIDEPEISLHPNLQLGYIKILKDAIKHWSGIHVILATHSHLMVSGLPADDSWIIHVSRTGRHQKSETHSYNPEYWTVDNVLYEIFHVATPRSIFFSQDVAEAIQLIDAEEKDKCRIQELLCKFKKLGLSGKDPVDLLIMEMEEALRD